VPVDLAKFLETAKAELRVSNRLGSGEAGNTMFVRDRHVITVNGNDTPERRRFTVLHEIAHIVLELPSVHGGALSSDTLFSYSRRPPEEVICDTFAAECLLPHEFLRVDVKDASASFSFVQTIAGKYEASLPCTASRIAVNAPFACAYVLSQEGYARFAAYSPSMRESGFWISPGIVIPAASITGQCLKSAATGQAGIVPAYIWTSRDEFADVDINEEACVLRAWKQALTLISIENDDAPDERKRSSGVERDQDEPLLRELDGILPWPSGRKRK
jgi:Zn-dependent peptidase ImmA (M78 family)